MKAYLTLLAFFYWGFLTFSQNSIIIPDTLVGPNIILTLQNGTHQFFSGINTSTMGANGNVLAPTLILNKGDNVNISVENQLGDTTTVHWHGLHVSPDNDGGPHTSISPGAIWNPSFTVLDKAATYWYHPHLHHKTNLHVSKGITGQIIVRDNDEMALNLPRKYGIDDFPIIIQTKDFDSNNEIVVPSNSDDVVMVNATIDPQLNVPAQLVRLRLLNGSSMRVFNIGMTNNQTFYQIASDGGLLASSNAITRLVIAPGERAEILVDLSAMFGQTVFLKSYASELPNGIYGATNPGMGAGMTLNGYDPNPLNGVDFNILQLDVIASTPNPVLTAPGTLVAVTPLLEANSNITRNLTMQPVSMGPNQLNGDFLINNVAFDMGVFNYSIPLNNIEIWSIVNQSGIAHPFHIHDVQFYVLDRNGLTPPLSEQGRKDVVLVKPQETVRFICQFEDFANDSIPYMYHCHMLIHEDVGMMGQFVVTDTATGIGGHTQEGQLKVFPNPSTGTFSILLEGRENVDQFNLDLRDINGKRIMAIKKFVNGQEIDLNHIDNGIYFLRIEADLIFFTEKVIVNK